MSKISTTKKITSPTTTEMNAQSDNTKELFYEPGNNVINNILNYSKVLSVRKSKSMKHFEIILN